LVKIPGLVRSAASLGGEQLRVLMRSLAQVQGQVSEAVVQKMVRAARAKATNNTEWMSIVEDLRSEVKDPSMWQQIQKAIAEVKGGDRNIPPGSAGAQVEAPGVGKVAGEEAFDPKQPMEIRKGPGSGEYKKPKIIADLEKLPKSKLFAPGQLEHIIFGNQNRAGRFTGWHHFSSRRPGERVRLKNNLSFDQLEKDSNGVYRATVEASFDKGKTWVPKTATNHTFFPNEWSKEKVVDEIASAFKEGRWNPKNLPPDLQDYDWVGRSKSGVLMAGYLDNSGNIVTAFPLFGE
jgi:Bacterial EndoU nuclease